jgi:hypothetical protein
MRFRISRIQFQQAEIIPEVRSCGNGTWHE